MFRRHGQLSEIEIYDVLANRRRWEVIRVLTDSPGRITVAELAAAIAKHETGKDPAPKAARDSVYASLHQTHLPKLHDHGIVNYDTNAREIRLEDGARDVDRYMDVVTRYGMTWGEYYQLLGIVGQLLVITSLIGVPLFGTINPLLWASAVLTVFAVSSGYQLWTSRWRLVRRITAYRND
ncbi:MAG: DUF7344 domain-containing protein [Halobacteriota archaeon]